MTKITTNDPETLSADVVAENVNHLKVLFPEAFTEGKVDFKPQENPISDHSQSNYRKTVA